MGIREAVFSLLASRPSTTQIKVKMILRYSMWPKWTQSVYGNSNIINFKTYDPKSTNSGPGMSTANVTEKSDILFDDTTLPGLGLTTIYF